MLSKCYLDQLKSARAIAVQACKKKKSKDSLIFNAHLEVKDNKLSTANTSNTEDKSGTFF